MAILSIVDVLNQWNQIGVFSYVLPFLLIFAVVYGILSKIKLFEENNAVNAIIALAIGLISLQLDFVPSFFQQIFPRFGIGLSILLIFVILMGFFIVPKDGQNVWDDYKWIGLVVVAAVVLWALTSWQWGGDSNGIGFWFEDNFWSLIIGILIVVAIYFMIRKEPTGKTGK